MMWTILLPLLSLSTLSTAVISPVCTKAPYDVVLPLSAFAPALSFCSAKFPLPPCTVKSTATSTVTASPITITRTVTTIQVLTTTGTIRTCTPNTEVLRLTSSTRNNFQHNHRGNSNSYASNGHADWYEDQTMTQSLVLPTPSSVLHDVNPDRDGDNGNSACYRDRSTTGQA